MAEREAVRLLTGVGGDVEWWVWTPNRIGHLRVALTAAEYTQVPPGCAVADAGESGPPRPRTREGNVVDTFRIGRAPDCRLRITDDEYVSPHHAMVVRDDKGRVWVQDLGSMNGTRIRRGALVVQVDRATELFPGDVLVVGRTEIPWTPS